MWDGFDEWWTGGEDGQNSDTHPYFQASSVTHSTLLNYLGIPAMTFGSTLSFNALPLRAYAKVYNDYYRDSQIIPEITIDTTDGLDSTTNTTLQKVSNPKDYFSTIRSEPQLGDELTVSLGGQAPVTGIGKVNQTYTQSSASVYETGESATRTYATSGYIEGSAAQNHYQVEQDPNNPGYPNINANLAAATGLSVDDLRLAIA